MPTPDVWMDEEYRARLNRYANPATWLAPDCPHEWVNANLLGPEGYHCADCGESVDGPSWMEELGFDGL